MTLAEGHDRDGQPALAVGQAGEGHVVAGAGLAVVLEGAAHGEAVLAQLAEVADPHGGGAGGGHADDALADGHLGADALVVVAVAGDGEQAPAVLVEEQQHRVGVAEQRGQAVDGGLHEGVEVAGAAEASGELGHRGEAVGGGSGVAGGERGPGRLGAAPGSGEVLDVEHPVDVGAAEAEDALHAGDGGDVVDVVAEAFEHRAASFGALVDDGESVLVVGERVDEQHAGAGSFGEVADGLGEELVRQGDVVVVDHAHPRQVGDVGGAGGVGGGDHRGNGPFEAGGEVGEGELPVAGHGPASSSSTVPAVGPGVWS